MRRGGCKNLVIDVRDWGSAPSAKQVPNVRVSRSHDGSHSAGRSASPTTTVFACAWSKLWLSDARLTNARCR